MKKNALSTTRTRRLCHIATARSLSGRSETTGAFQPLAFQHRRPRLHERQRQRAHGEPEEEVIGAKDRYSRPSGKAPRKCASRIPWKTAFPSWKTTRKMPPRQNAGTRTYMERPKTSPAALLKPIRTSALAASQRKATARASEGSKTTSPPPPPGNNASRPSQEPRRHSRSSPTNTASKPTSTVVLVNEVSHTVATAARASNPQVIQHFRRDSLVRACRVVTTTPVRQKKAPSRAPGDHAARTGNRPATPGVEQWSMPAKGVRWIGRREQRRGAIRRQVVFMKNQRGVASQVSSDHFQPRVRTVATVSLRVLVPAVSPTI